MKTLGKKLVIMQNVEKMEGELSNVAWLLFYFHLPTYQPIYLLTNHLPAYLSSHKRATISKLAWMGGAKSVGCWDVLQGGITGLS